MDFEINFKSFSELRRNMNKIWTIIINLFIAHGFFTWCILNIYWMFIMYGTHDNSWRGPIPVPLLLLAWNQGWPSLGPLQFIFKTVTVLITAKTYPFPFASTYRRNRIIYILCYYWDFWNDPLVKKMSNWFSLCARYIFLKGVASGQ